MKMPLLPILSAVALCLAKADAQSFPPPPPPVPAQAVAPQVQHVGLPSAQMDFVAASQRNTQWCWAACIEMVLRHHGVLVSQEQIVARTYGTDPAGRLPNWAGSFQAITANLNNWSFDNRGRLFAVGAMMVQGAPLPAMLVRELEQGRPLIIGYASGPNSGHAVVVTGASYIGTSSAPQIVSLVVRDPWPDPRNIANSGRRVHDAGQLAPLIQAAWMISLR